MNNDRRNVVALAACQALLVMNNATMISIGTLAADTLATNKMLVTIPATAYIIGGGLTTLPISLFMKRRGRRAGFMVGCLAGMAGGARRSSNYTCACSRAVPPRPGSAPAVIFSPRAQPADVLQPGAAPRFHPATAAVAPHTETRRPWGTYALIKMFSAGERPGEAWALLPRAATAPRSGKAASIQVCPGVWTRRPRPGAGA